MGRDEVTDEDLDRDINTPRTWDFFEDKNGYGSAGFWMAGCSLVMRWTFCR